MRDIKFRGWHTTQKKMYSAEEMAADQLTLLPTGEFINVNGRSTSLSVIYPRDKFIPLQYTGLKDKPGNEIYEGDILQERDGEYIRRLQVCFGTFWHVTGDSRDGVDDEGGFAIGFYLKDYYGKHTFPENKGYALFVDKEENYIAFLEVIGNIYENPELLKGEDSE